MGICCNNSNSRNPRKRNDSLTIEKSNLSKFKKKYYNEGGSSLFVSTAEASSKPEIYSINKFGIQVKTKQKITKPLKFIFHLYDFKCKMLIEDTLYILQVILDGKEFPLSFGKGTEPNFVFDETLGKEITFEDMSTSYLEIYLYTHKAMLNNIQTLTKGEILAESQIYSCFKINLLTIALAPKKHDLILLDPKRLRVQLGRISYCVSCRHVEDLYIRINGFRINLNYLKYNEISLNLKFLNKNFVREIESQYTDNFDGIPNKKENSMIYEYSNDKVDISLNEGLSEDSSYLISDESRNNFQDEENNKSQKNNINKKNDSEKNMSNKGSNKNNNKSQENDNKYSNNKNKLSEKLYLHGNMSMDDLYNSEITINVFSVRLQNNVNEDEFEKKESASNKTKKGFFMKKLDLPNVAKNYHRKSKLNNIINLNLINSYELIGTISLNFNLILHELEEKLSKISYRLFQSMSNKKNTLIKTLSGSKIMKFGIEEDLTNKVQSNKNLHNINNNDFQYKIQNLIINFFGNENLKFQESIYYEGELIGNVELNLEINNLPLIRQIKFGVMTETGSEINSIFLYDNLNISNNLPEKLLDLIKLKERFEQEIDFSILKKIKLCLEETVIENFLYYGYSSTEDLYQSQSVIIDLGLGLFDLIDKVNFEYLNQIFDILKLILKRSEFDLGTLSKKWFKPKRVIKKKESTYYLNNIDSNVYFSFNYDELAYEFNDNYLIDKHLIKKYLNFHSELLNFCLNNLVKGKNISKGNMEFTYYYLSFAFFQIPPFRDSFIKSVYSSINLENEKYLKFSSHNYLNFSKKDSSKLNPNSNFTLWDILFYKRLDSSINIYLTDINKKNKNDKKNITGIENINAIKEQLMNIKYITEIKEESKNNLDFHHQNWHSRLSKRDFVFYEFISELFYFMNKLKNKLYMNINTDQENYLFNAQNNDKITDITGISTLLNSIYYDLLIKDAKNYPKQIKEIIPQFYSDISTINNFISIIISTTNVYDTLSIFNIIDILDYLFNKKFESYDYNQDYLKDNIDYNLIKKSFFIIINSDNSLAIAKFIWFYYKNISLLSYSHVKEIISSILISLFFKLFFHWSFQVREIFYYFNIFILGFKIKKQIKREKIENIEDKIINNEIITHSKIKNTINRKISFNIFGNINKELIQRKDRNLNEYFYVENYLEENMDIINRLRKIIEKEKFDLMYMDNIGQIKDEKILEKIPEEPHGNLIECIKQYNFLLTKFNIWKKNIEENNVAEDKIEYPTMEISIIKDDTIQYDS